MEQYAIKGGNPLVGEVEIGGAKNAALPILAASVMTDETVYIENLPDVRDINVLLKAMQNVGVMTDRTGRHSVTLNSELLKYKLEALDYVIVHELCHIIHFDHSKDFWNLVGKYYPEYKKIRKYLKE